MQMLYCFINNVHVDYVDLLWEGLHYSLTHLTTLIPYPRFTKLIIDHYMTVHPDISRRVHDNYHNLNDDDLVKNIFKYGKNKDVEGMRIPRRTLMDDMKLTNHYQMYTVIFRVDVLMTQLQPIEYTKEMHRTTSAPGTPNTEVIEGESSAQHKSTIIRLHNVAKVKEHMVDEELDQLLEGAKNVDMDAFMDDVFNCQKDLDTKIEPRSDKESPEAEKDADMVTISNDDMEEESAGDEFELRK
ncbi:hypothetical protein Tco_0005953 [Tanacetum coccineum]